MVEPTRAPHTTLAELALKHGTDKEGAHHYARHYENHLAHLRTAPVRLLEIGIGGYEDPSSGGASLRMWKEYFPQGSIVGLDVYDKKQLEEDRIHVVRGSQTDAKVIEGIAYRFGPFDVVIDDGSHVPRDVVTTFRLLFHHLADRGIYAVEDLQTSYWYSAGGSKNGIGRRTSMGFFLSLSSGLNYEEFDIPRYRPTRFDVAIESVAFYHNLVVVTKGPNLEGSNMLPPHPRGKRHFGLSQRAKNHLVHRARRNDALGRVLDTSLRVRRGIRDRFMP